MEIRLEMKIAESGSRANDIANNSQSTKKGNHAARAMPDCLMTLQTMAVEIISTPGRPGCSFTERTCRFTESLWSNCPASTSFEP